MTYLNNKTVIEETEDDQYETRQDPNRLVIINLETLDRDTSYSETSYTENHLYNTRQNPNRLVIADSKVSDCETVTFKELYSNFRIQYNQYNTPVIDDLDALESETDTDLVASINSDTEQNQYRRTRGLNTLNIEDLEAENRVTDNSSDSNENFYTEQNQYRRMRGLNTLNIEDLEAENRDTDTISGSNINTYTEQNQNEIQLNLNMLVTDDSESQGRNSDTSSANSLYNNDFDRERRFFLTNNSQNMVHEAHINDLILAKIIAENISSQKNGPLLYYILSNNIRNQHQTFTSSTDIRILSEYISEYVDIQKDDDRASYIKSNSDMRQSFKLENSNYNTFERSNSNSIKMSDNRLPNNQKIYIYKKYFLLLIVIGLNFINFYDSHAFIVLHLIAIVCQNILFMYFTFDFFINIICFCLQPCQYAKTFFLSTFCFLISLIRLLISLKYEYSLTYN